MFLKKTRGLAIWLTLALVLGITAVARLNLVASKPSAKRPGQSVHNIFSAPLYGFFYEPKENDSAAGTGRTSKANVRRSAISVVAGGASLPVDLAGYATSSLSVRQAQSGAVTVFNQSDGIDPIWVRASPSALRNNRHPSAPGEKTFGYPDQAMRFPVISKSGNASLEPAPAGLDALLGSDDNPFIAAIKENFGTRPLPPAPEPKPQKEESAVVKSPPAPTPPSTDQEVGRVVAQIEGGSAKYSNAYVYVGDMGNHHLQISAAAKTGPQSFAVTVDGILGIVRFESGLNLGPLQSFSVSRAGTQAGVVVVDGVFNSIYLYTAVAPDQFVAGDGLYIPIAGAVIAGATLSDVNSDGLVDLIVGAWFPDSEQSFVYLFLQKDGTFVYNRRFLTDISIGGVYVSRSGGVTSILAVDQSLALAELLTLDTSGSAQSRVGSILPVRKQDTKITLSDGRPLWIRLAEFADVTLLGSYSAAGEFGLIGAVENAGPLPSMAIGDLQQGGQRRCWLHF